LRAREHETPPGRALSTRERAAVPLCSPTTLPPGFPEAGQVANPRVYLQDLYDRTLTRDIAMRHGVRHIKTLKDIAFYVAKQLAGGKLTYQNIASGVFTRQPAHREKLPVLSAGRLSLLCRRGVLLQGEGADKASAQDVRDRSRHDQGYDRRTREPRVAA